MEWNELQNDFVVEASDGIRQTRSATLNIQLSLASKNAFSFCLVSKYEYVRISLEIIDNLSNDAHIKNKLWLTLAL